MPQASSWVNKSQRSDIMLGHDGVNLLLLACARTRIASSLGIPCSSFRRRSCSMFNTTDLGNAVASKAERGRPSQRAQARELHGAPSDLLPPSGLGARPSRPVSLRVCQLTSRWHGRSDGIAAAAALASGWYCEEAQNVPLALGAEGVPWLSAPLLRRGPIAFPPWLLPLPPTLRPG